MPSAARHSPTHLFAIAAMVLALVTAACTSSDPSLQPDDTSDRSGTSVGGTSAPTVEGSFVIRATADTSGVPEGSLVGEIEFVDGGSDCTVQGHLGGLGRDEAACAAGLASTELTMRFPRGVIIAPGCDEPTWSVEIVLLELTPAGDSTDRFTGQMTFVSDLLRECDGLIDDTAPLRAPSTFTDTPLPVEVVPAGEAEG